jgi:hypothetical protein
VVVHHMPIDRQVAVRNCFPDQAGKRYTASFVEAGRGLVHRRTGCADAGCTDRIGNLKKHARAAGHRIDLVMLRCCVTPDTAHVVVLERCGRERRKCQ